MMFSSDPTENHNLFPIIRLFSPCPCASDLQLTPFCSVPHLCKYIQFCFEVDQPPTIQMHAQAQN